MKRRPPTVARLIQVLGFIAARQILGAEAPSRARDTSSTPDDDVVVRRRASGRGKPPRR